MRIFVADKGYDSEALRAYVGSKGGETVIPKRNYGQEIDKESIDWCLYKYRHLVENSFARIKRFRSISTRYDELAKSYASMLSQGVYNDVAADLLLNEICTSKITGPRH